ncbi:MAG: Glyoxalase-like domain protein, partial [Acidobacteria bacterium]|nr:Glyoxalase-like domain protein [Acidobacteriota bacterium]
WAVSVGVAAVVWARLQRAGFFFSPLQRGSRVNPAGSSLHWTRFGLVQPPIASAPFFIQWSASTVHPSASSPGGCSLAAFEIEDPQSAELSRLLAILDVHASVQSGERSRMTLRLRCGTRQATFSSIDAEAQ